MNPHLAGRESASGTPWMCISTVEMHIQAPLMRTLGRLHPPLQLLGPDVLDVRADPPLIAGRIAYAAGAVAIELVGRLAQGDAARLDAAAIRGVDVLDVEAERRGHPL